MKKIFILIFTIVSFFFIITTIKANTVVTLFIEGDSRYDLSVQAAKKINSEREKNNLEQLTLDEELTTIATNRAREIAIHYDHVTPMGEDVMSYYDVDNEIIAHVSDNVIQVIDEWMENDYSVLFNSNYRSIGIGCYSVEGYDYQTYWVAVFKTSQSDFEFTSTSSVHEENEIRVDSKYIKNIGVDYLSSTNTLLIGETYFSHMLWIENSNLSGVHTYLRNTSASWTSSDSNVVSIDSDFGAITGLSGGSSYIQAKIGNVLSPLYEVKVEEEEVLPTGIYIRTNGNVKTVYLGAEEKTRLEAVIVPSYATDKSVVWTSSDERIAKIDQDGMITPISLGEVTFTATTINNMKATYRVTIEDLDVIEITDLTLEPTSFTAYVGEEKKIDYHITPSNATSSTITFTSSDSNVAIVDSTGMVTAIGPGTARIIASFKNGVTAVCVITVLESEIKVESITFADQERTIELGDTYTLEPIIRPQNASNKTVQWSVSKEGILTVDKNGLISTIAIGDVVVTASVGDLSGQITIHVIEPSIKPTGVELHSPKSEIEVGEVLELETVITPSTVSNTSLSWKSSNSSLASISQDGKVTGLMTGTVQITVTTVNNLSDSVEIKIIDKKAEVNNITINDHEENLLEGNQMTLIANITPVDANNQSLVWTSSDESIATVSNGVVTALKDGTVTITVTSKNGVSTSTTIHVVSSSLEVSTVSFDQTILHINIGDSYCLQATIYPENATIKTLSWESSSPSVATVDDSGKITAYQVGTTTITATSTNGKEARCVVEVLDPSLVPTGVVLNKTKETVYVGDYLSLIAEIKPKGVVNQNIEWTSSNEEVATVDKGRVHAIKEGTTTITASAYNGVSESCTIIVKMPEIILEDNEIVLEVGKSHLLEVTTNPKDVSKIFYSDQEEIAVVDSEGNITAISPGDASITIETSNGDKAICHVIVIQRPTKIIPSSEDITLEEGEEEQIRITFEPANTSETALVWESSNPKIATVANGFIKGIAAGTAMITVTGVNRISAQIMVTVVPKEGVEVEPTGIQLNRNELSLKVGSYSYLDGEVLPSNATNKAVTWESSDSRIASVDKTGKVIGISVGEAIITAKTINDKKAECRVTIVPNPQSFSVLYMTHVEDYGDQKYVKNGAMSGTSGQSKRLEAIRIKLENQPYTGNIEYRTHVQDIGWMSYVKNGAMSGTSGKAKRLEAIQIRLTGKLGEKYDVYYRVHAQDVGWMNWAKNDEMAGTAGYGRRLEGIEIVVVEKGQNPPSRSNIKSNKAFLQKQISYTTHVQDIGWQSEVADGTMSGTSGQSKRLEGIKIKLYKPTYNGSIRYKTHVQDIGWQSFVYDGAMSGTSGQSKRLEAIRVELTGSMASHYDIYYRVHAENFGWMNWAKNGESAGTAHYSYRLEGIEIVLVDKGEAPPTRTNIKTSKAFIDKNL